MIQALSDKTRFELFARTVPPDTFQVSYLGKYLCCLEIKTANNFSRHFVILLEESLLSHKKFILAVIQIVSW